MGRRGNWPRRCCILSRRMWKGGGIIFSEPQRICRKISGKCWRGRIRFLVLFPVRGLIGEEEKERISSEDLANFDSVAEVVEPKDYLELLFQLGVASAVVCNDTGPGHLAGIIGTPTIALFGASDPARWKPLGPRVQTIRGTTMEAISVEAVYDAAAKAAG